MQTCAWCSKTIYAWQAKKPLGGGKRDSYGQYEHPDCQAQRDVVIAEGRTIRARALKDLHRARQKENNE